MLPFNGIPLYVFKEQGFEWKYLGRELFTLKKNRIESINIFLPV
jgi:hypothetical protein